MLTRVLPASEWPKLAGFACAEALRDMPEGTCRVVVAEDEGRIVGVVVFWAEVQCDGFEVVPDRRYESSVTEGLMRAAAVEARTIGGGLVVSTVTNPTLAAVLDRCEAEVLPPKRRWSLEKAVQVLYERGR